MVALVVKEKNFTIPKRLNQTFRRILYPLEFEGQVSEHIDHPTSLGIFLTDSTHKPIETIIADEVEKRSGTVKLSYFMRSQYPEGTYYVELKINGIYRPLKEIKLGEGQ